MWLEKEENWRWIGVKKKLEMRVKKNIRLQRNEDKEMMEYFGNGVGDKEFGNLEERK